MVYGWKIDWLKPVCPTAILVGLVFLCMALLCILVDLGRPDRALFLLRHARLESPLVWDFLAFMVCGIIGLAIFILTLRHERPGHLDSPGEAALLGIGGIGMLLFWAGTRFQMWFTGCPLPIDHPTAQPQWEPSPKPRENVPDRTEKEVAELGI